MIFVYRATTYSSYLLNRRTYKIQDPRSAVASELRSVRCSEDMNIDLDRAQLASIRQAKASAELEGVL